MKVGPSKEITEFEHGTFQAVLKGATIYSSEKYNTQIYQVNITLLWDMGEDDAGNSLIFHDGFIPVPVDEQGCPRMSNSKSKLYNRISALAGVRFDATQVGSEIDIEYKTPEEWDSPEGWQQFPHWNEVKQDKDLEVPLDIIINGKSVIGKLINIELGNAQKPDGTLSERTSVINASIPPKERIRKPKPIAGTSKPRMTPVKQGQEAASLPV